MLKKRFITQILLAALTLSFTQISVADDIVVNSPKTNVDTREKAQQEIQSLSPRAKQAQSQMTRTQSQEEQAALATNSMLNLTDTYRGITRRNYDFSAGFQFESYQLNGQQRLATGGTQQLSGASQVIPRISVGTRYNLIEAGQSLSALYLGLEGGLAVSTHSQTVGLSARQIDAQITSLIFDVGIKTSVALSSHPRLSLGLLLGLGQAEINQSGSESLADWQTQERFSTTQLSADYDISQGWFASVGYNYRQKLSSSGSSLEIEPQSWKAGLGVVW